MVEIVKPGTVKEPEKDAVIVETSTVKPEDVVVEHDDAKPGTTARTQQTDPLSEIRAQMETAQAEAKTERERRETAERERDTARSQVDTTKAHLVKSESEKVVNQEAAIVSHLEAMKSEVENAERALEEAIDTGKTAKEQIALQRKHAESIYKLKGAETTKIRFDNWKEQQKNKPAPTQTQTPPRSQAAQKWIDDHPRFNSDLRYQRMALRAHEDAVDAGVEQDSSEYFRRINAALAESGLESDGNAAAVSVPPVRRNSGTSTAAPVSQNSTAAGAQGGSAAEGERTGRRVFKLDGGMREMALKIYGKGTSFNLSEDEAYKRYASKQIEIRDKRAKGEKI